MKLFTIGFTKSPPKRSLRRFNAPLLVKLLTCD